MMLRAADVCLLTFFAFAFFIFDFHFIYAYILLIADAAHDYLVEQQLWRRSAAQQAQQREQRDFTAYGADAQAMRCYAAFAIDFLLYFSSMP